jgi:hypothetical protein
MMCIRRQDYAQRAKECYSTADCYSEGQKIVRLQGGKEISRPGLEGTVDKLSFERLYDNLDAKNCNEVTAPRRSQCEQWAGRELSGWLTPVAPINPGTPVLSSLATP